jgi:hypothetical protein
LVKHINSLDKGITHSLQMYRTKGQKFLLGKSESPISVLVPIISALYRYRVG